MSSSSTIQNASSLLNNNICKPYPKPKRPKPSRLEHSSTIIYLPESSNSQHPSLDSDCSIELSNPSDESLQLLLTPSSTPNKWPEARWANQQQVRSHSSCSSASYGTIVMAPSTATLCYHHLSWSDPLLFLWIPSNYGLRANNSASSLRQMYMNQKHMQKSAGGDFAGIYTGPSAAYLKSMGEKTRRYSFGALGGQQPGVKRRHSQRRKNSYWDSLERYTTLPISSGEEKCNGDVRFEVAEQETSIGDNTGGLLGSTDNSRKNTVTHRQIRRRQSGYGISITSESTAKMRCKMRKHYFLKRNKVCDLSLLLGLVGLILVVIDSELTALRVLTKQSPASLMLRGLCVMSTLLLVASLINYHRIEVKIALIDSGADDWRVALTTERLIKLSIEIAVCAICPFPGSGTISWPYISSSEGHNISMVRVPLDVILSVPMFLRSYLLCRFMVLHSKQFQDAATRSIAALNRISMDFRFVIKTMMADHPLTVLVVFTVSYWICMSWMFTQCERYNDNKLATEHYYLNSLWFIMVTFMSIGYGDVVPTGYCGRLLSITTGIVGAGVSSALIAVISRKLELSRAEKHVNNFMSDSKLTNQRKNAAASVLQHTWFIHKYQRNGHKGDDLRLRQHQRKFLNAINDFRRIKWDQRKLQEKGNSLLDVGKLHNEMHETLWEMHRTQDQFITQIDMLTQRIIELQAAVLTNNNQGAISNAQFPAAQPTTLFPMSSPSTQLRQLSAGSPGTQFPSTPPPPQHLRVPHQQQPGDSSTTPPTTLNNGYGSIPSLQKFASTPPTSRKEEQESNIRSTTVIQMDNNKKSMAPMVAAEEDGMRIQPVCH
uniref:Calmodulin-binding domain-containing protein n=1 Tax=Ditylenchus dipsaci TaxID=166011 RepID=A0A915EX76_9BILA